MKLLRLRFRFEKFFARVSGREKPVYVYSITQFYENMWKKAAQKIGAKFIKLDDGLWEVRYRNRKTRIFNHMVQIDDPVILNLAANKVLCYQLFQNERLSVPKHFVFSLDEIGKAKCFMEKFDGPFVVKPAIGTGAGAGVTTHIRSFQECRHAAVLASLYCNKIILEHLIPGESYRFLVLNGKVIHAARRQGIHVYGDGKSTISQLIEKENERLKKIRGNDRLRPIKINSDDEARLLHQQGLSSESLPEAKRDILVKSFDNPTDKNIEVRTVYDEDVTELVCKELYEEAVRAAQALNSKFAGVDIITLNPNVSLKKSGGAIVEINTTPGLHHHYNLKNNVAMVSTAECVLKYLLKAGS